MENSHIYLTGYRGCGKSTVRELLANQLDLPSCDLDDRIEQTARKSIQQIFAEESETGFRDRESEALRFASGQPRQVIALGGGAILRRENRDLIRQTGWTIWLDAEPAIVAERLLGDSTTPDRRPALTKLPPLEEIQTVMASRESLYADVADLRIDTGLKDIESIVTEIVAAWSPRDQG